MLHLTKREKILAGLCILFAILSILFALLRFLPSGRPDYSVALLGTLSAEVELLSASLDSFIAVPTIEKFWLLQMHTAHAFALSYIPFVANMNYNQQTSSRWCKLGKTLNPLETKLASYIEADPSLESLTRAASELKLLQVPLKEILKTLKQWEQAPADPIKAAEFWQSADDLHLAVDKLNP